MVYVSGDGTVYQERPWSVGKVMAIFWGIINLIVAFFQTLIPGFMDNGSSTSNGFRSGGSNRGANGRGSSGYGGGGYGSGRRPPRPPGPGNVRGLGSLPPDPPPACGSCCGR